VTVIIPNKPNPIKPIIAKIKFFLINAIAFEVLGNSFTILSFLYTNSKYGIEELKLLVL
jgi:hypothetical protein